MSDLISRQAVLDELEKWDWQDLYLPIHFKQILDDVPSVENKGEWIWQTEDIYKCSECGEDIHVKEVMNEPQYVYCPMCRADMRGE